MAEGKFDVGLKQALEKYDQGNFDARLEELLEEIDRLGDGEAEGFPDKEIRDIVGEDLYKKWCRSLDSSSTLLVAASLGYPRDEASATAFVARHKRTVDNLDKGGNSCLVQAIRNDHLHFFNALLSNGAEVNLSCYRGNTALLEAANKGRTHYVNILLKKGANIHHSNGMGNTALLEAANQGRSAVISILRQKGANINHSNDKGNTALLGAAKRGDTNTITTLLQQGADIFHKNKNGETALHLAAESRHADAAIELLMQGAGLHVKNKDGVSALERSKEMLLDLDDPEKNWQIEVLTEDVKKEIKDAVRGRPGKTVGEEQAFNVNTLQEAAGNFLVVATLIVTTSYSAYLNPPKGWTDGGFVRQSLVVFLYANNVSFFSAVGVIFLCIFVVVPGTTVPGADLVRRQLNVIVALVLLSTMSAVIAFIAAALATSERKHWQEVVVPGILTLGLVFIGFNTRFDLVRRWKEELYFKRHW